MKVMDSTQEFYRIQKLPPYVFAVINEMKAKARAANLDVVDLGMGNPDGATPEPIVKKLIDAARNPRFYGLLRTFHQQTGCPVLVNTSFNVRGEPIVCTPDDAFSCFMGTEIEFLAVGNCILRKDQQNPALAMDYKNAFDSD